MRLVRYNPLQDLQSFWGSDWSAFPSITETAPMDLYEEDGNLVAEVSLPNFSKEEISVTAEHGVLEVSAEHQEKEENKGKRRYYVRESSSHYVRRVALPEGVHTEKTEASFKDGVLKVTIPVLQPKKTSKKVAVK